MTRRAVLIANCEFPSSTQLQALTTPQNDIERLGVALKDLQRGGFESVEFLKDSASQEVRLAIDKALRESDPEDLVLIYYSGHGVLSAGKKLLLATSDTRDGVQATMVSFNDVAGWVDTYRNRRVVLILDCCYSGAAGSSLSEIKGSRRRVYPNDLRKFARHHGYGPTGEDPSIESKGNGAVPESLDPMEARDGGRGIYLLTACSSLETAHGDKRGGGGIFTRHVIDGLSAEGGEPHPKNESAHRITPHSLHRYVCERMRTGETGQTPLLWVTKQSGPSLVISEIALAGRWTPGMDRRNRWRVLQTERNSLLGGLGPTYLLDNAFKFVDWNSAFEELVAQPLQLTRGMHAESFLQRLANSETVINRSLRVFMPGNYPKIDIEEFFLNSNRFGQIRFHKVGSQIRESTGRRIAWCVHLNISHADKDEELWKRLSEIMNMDANWSQYAACYDEIIGSFSEYQALVRKVTSFVRGRGNILDLGSGTGNATLKLMADNPACFVTAVDRNEAMLHRLDGKLGKFKDRERRVALIKDDISSFLREEKRSARTYNACVMLNVLFALDDPKAVLQALFDVLTPGATLSLSTSHEKTSIQKLFSEIYSELERSGRLDKLEDQYKEAAERNVEMNDIIKRYSEAHVRHFIESAGFEIREWHPRQYADCVVVVRAEKPV